MDPKNSAADSFIIHREGDKEVAKIPVTTIDKLVAELKLERVDFIKMDIEGAEQRAGRRQGNAGEISSTHGAGVVSRA